MLIAVASKSGTEVDQHFGHAQRFLIYDYGSGNPTPVKEVEVEKYCSYDPDHPFRHPQFNGIVEALKGCKAVVTEMIGELPKQELHKVGITPIMTTGPIGEALKLAHDQVCGGTCKGGTGAAGNCRKV
jgi:predicted Fe-Mo cluster-binding NifX family protein